MVLRGHGQAGASSAGDPYTPNHGNGGYHVESYGLDLDYRVNSNRLTGRAGITAVADQTLTRFALDLSGLRATKVTINGRRVSRFTQRAGKLHITPASTLMDGAEFVVDIQYAGNPKP